MFIIQRPPAHEADAMILQALRRDVLSHVRTADNYYENVDFLWVQDGEAIFEHKTSMQFFTMPVKETGTI